MAAIFSLFVFIIYEETFIKQILGGKALGFRFFFMKFSFIKHIFIKSSDFQRGVEGNGEKLLRQFRTVMFLERGQSSNL